jgi:diguanylate cyclase (GGDEF)-like protein
MTEGTFDHPRHPRGSVSKQQQFAHARPGMVSPIRLRDMIEELDERAEKVERDSNVDKLTGLKNQDAFYREKELLMKALQEEGGMIIFADLDRLKSINDGLGHDEGDLYIQKAADLFRRETEVRDSRYRLGGDEFVLVLFGIPEEAVVKKLQEILATAQNNWTKEEADALLPHSSHPNTAPLFSMGAVHVEKDSAIGFDSLVKLADKAMYEAKAQKKVDPGKPHACIAGYDLSDLHAAPVFTHVVSQ